MRDRFTWRDRGKQLLQQLSVASTPDTLPLHGVRLSFLTSFIDKSGGRQRFQNLTTQVVCDTIVKPQTHKSKSLCDHLQLTAPESVARANWFISHSWQYKFLDVVDAIEIFFFEKKIPADTVIIWFDLFSLCQHGRRAINPDWLKTIFITAIKELGNFIMVMSPWDKPQTLTRAWCIFELYACVSANYQVNIAIPPTDGRAFLAFNTAGDLEQMRVSVGGVSTANSKATKKQDLAAIHKAIRQTVGFEALDRIVRGVLFDWMATAHLQLIRKGNSDPYWFLSLGSIFCEMGLFAKGRKMIVEYAEKRKVWRPQDWEVTGYADKRVKLLQAKGKFDEAERFAREYLARVEEERGRGLGKLFGHNDVVAPVRMLARVYRRQGRYEDAEGLLRNYLTSFERKHPKNDYASCCFRYDLARLHLRRGHLDDAEKLFHACLDNRPPIGKSRSSNLTLAHPLLYVVGLVKVYELQGRTEEGSALIQQYVDSENGASQKETWLIDMVQMFREFGYLYGSCEDYKKGIMAYRDGARLMRQWDNRKSEEQARILSGDWQKIDNVEDEDESFRNAKRLYLEEADGAMRGRTRIVTPLRFVRVLAALYGRLGNHVQADFLYEECVQRARTTLMNWDDLSYVDDLTRWRAAIREADSKVIWPRWIQYKWDEQ
ncbi:hypothetical protein HDV00_004591 [Rhizophlyctis rosea]|nr:hypothetical protein HDV00_004591 [Rhizophlyctis rosea]